MTNGFPNLNDFLNNQVWIFSEEGECYLPLTNLDQPIYDVEDFCIYSEIVFANGAKVYGFVLGKGKNVVSFYAHGRWYVLNRFWSDASRSQIMSFISLQTSQANYHSYLPLRFKTLVKDDSFINFEGKFDVF